MFHTSLIRETVLGIMSVSSREEMSWLYSDYLTTNSIPTTQCCGSIVAVNVIAWINGKTEMHKITTITANTCPTYLYMETSVVPATGAEATNRHVQIYRKLAHAQTNQ